MTEWLNQGDPAATILLMGAVALGIAFVLGVGCFWIKERLDQQRG